MEISNRPGVERALKNLIAARLLTGLCVLVLTGILIAGLWPFHAPKNEVSWLSPGEGLYFGKYGSIVSAGPFQTPTSQRGNSCSLEIWLEPSRVDSGGTILSFYRPESRAVPFALRQWREGLVLQLGGKNAAKTSHIYIGNVFSSRKPVFVTITSSAAGTSTYVDGTLVERDPSFVLANRDLTGEFIVGNSPSKAYNWSGRLKGLAIYNRELSANETAQNILDWRKGSRKDSTKSQDVIALYTFDEGTGSLARNRVNFATDLLIPERFFVINERFLEAPWNEFRAGWRYWKDLGVNVFGFGPLGFFFYAYFSQLRKTQHPAVATIVFGFAVSLTIEVLQAFLPTRDSGITDLITNTLGTAIGVIAFRHEVAHAALAAVGLNAD